MENRKVIFRQIVPGDNLFLSEMIRAVFIEYNAPRQGTVFSDPTTDDLYQLFQAPKSVLWVAVVDDNIAGSCGIYPTAGLDSSCAELVKFYLAKSARGKGIGKKLLEKCIESAKELGYKQLYLESLPQFSKAVSMYERQGFTRLSQSMGCSGHSTCNIWMLKEL